MKNFVFVVLLLGFVGLSAEVLNLEQAKELALENSSSYKAAKAEYKSAVYSTWSSFVGLFGTASATFGFTQLSDKGEYAKDNSKSYGVTFSQPLFNKGANWLNYRIKADTEEMKKLAYEEKEFVTLAEVETKYFNLLMAQRELEIAENDLKSSQQSLEQAKIKSKTGSLSKVDVLTMEAEVKSKEVVLLSKQNSYLQSRNQFCDFLHIADNDLELAPIDLSDYQVLFDKVKKLDISRLDSIMVKIIRLGESRNLSLKSLEEQKEIAQKGKIMAALSPLPSVNASYAYKKDENFSGSYKEASKVLSIDVSMPISFLPFCDNYFAYQKARYDLRRVEAENYNTETQLKLEIKAAVYTFVSSAKQVVSAEFGVDAAEGVFEQNQAKYKNGLLSTANFLDALNTYQSAQLNLVLAKNSFFTARSDLKRLLVIKEDSELEKLF